MILNDVQNVVGQYKLSSEYLIFYEIKIQSFKEFLAGF